ncbi:MAG: hypothetical protein ACO3HJ_07665 [Methylophilaceae bacterium]
MDKYAIEELAADIADDMGYDYFDLSPKMKAKIYKIALDEHSNMLADKADMMRKNEASGGLMRTGYAMGSEKDIPEQEDIPMEEFDDIKKMLGVPMDQASGIKSLKNEMASMDANEKEFMRLVDEFMENGFSLQEAIEEAKRELEEKSVRRKAPSIKMAEYEPGDYDPLIVDEYEKYKYDAEEQGQPVMSIDDFLRMARSQAMGGGIMRTNFNAGSAEIYEPERRERQAEIREEKATDIPSRRKAKDLDINIEKVKALIEAAKKDKIKRQKGGVASILGD